MKTVHAGILAGAAVLCTAASPGAPDAPGASRPVIIDTDLGSAADDAFALALALASPELELRGVTTVGGSARDRAWIACRFLSHSGHGEVPVAWGRAPQPEYGVDDAIQYRRHPGVVFGRTSRPVDETAVAFLDRRIRASPEEPTIVALGPLTNIARLIERHPECRRRIRRIVWMGGALRVGYDGTPPPEREWNLRHDVDAARTVLDSGVPLLVVPLDATHGLELRKPLRDRLFAACTRLTFQVEALHQLSGGGTPTLFDALAVGLAADERFATVRERRLALDEDGMLRAPEGPPDARVALSCDEDAFLEWLVERIASHGERCLPESPGNAAELEERGGLPRRVHAVEDFETDIERRWWLSGRPETANTPPGSRRACRSVVTRDFDDLQGQTGTAYAAVVFNPVPGPPVGPRTRLAFRYWLRGTDNLRIQLYSLTKGYHRYLSLEGLPEGRWQAATADLTAMRRPDGSGGPLSDGERVDDIQFYADPRAELLIDDIVLYEAAPSGEERPFPARVVFTAWFDTGRAGREWPGDLDIVTPETPRRGKAARSVVDPESGRPGIRVRLRGRRKLAETTRLRFHYRLSATSALRIVVADTTTGRSAELAVPGPVAGRWTEAFADVPVPEDPGERLRYADEVRFAVDPGAELLLDDLLVYEPGPAEPLPEGGSKARP